MAASSSNNKRKHPGSMPPSVHGHTCKICNVIGEHLEDACPAKSLVHLPRTFRKEVHDQTVAAVRETFFTPPNFIAGGELLCLLRERRDVPPSLACACCTKLAQQAVWCAHCDIIACAACLGPASEPYMCCRCHSSAPDNFHAVGALRKLADAWAQAMALCVDRHTVLRGVVGGPADKTTTRQYNRQ